MKIHPFSIIVVLFPFQYNYLIITTIFEYKSLSVCVYDKNNNYFDYFFLNTT